MNSASDLIETADIETSSDDYARRFSGAIGAWFLKIQEDATLRMLSAYPGASVLDVGGGHGQLAGALIQRGYHVTVVGSADVCKARLGTFISEGRCDFKAGNLLALPYPDRAFDVVISYRLLAHVIRWSQLIRELTRVARETVVIDYPSIRSFNWVATHFFGFKKRIEGNTRPFACFKEADLVQLCETLGFARVDRYPEFFLPMVIHRLVQQPALSTTAEALFRVLGITSMLGSPVIVKFRRKHASR
jgi:2-polyprenyl-3-methyl-5-hydroxy-6-metoxy-1,4-benzoquinol methylase